MASTWYHFVQMQKHPEDFASLVKNDKFQVFLMGCQCRLVLCFAKHHWFVVNNKGKISRWEVLMEKDDHGKGWGHLHLNAHKPFEAFGTITPHGKAFFEPELFGYIEGDEGSTAEKMVHFINKSPDTYPYCYFYSLLSPNSNTYAQWILGHFPEFPARLSWTAFGKGYKVVIN
jgi:hypothetical protein